MEAFGEGTHAEEMAGYRVVRAETARPLAGLEHTVAYRILLAP